VNTDSAGDTALLDKLADPARLAALRATGLSSTGSAPTLDRLTSLAARLIQASSSQVSLVEPGRQFFASAFGLTGELAITRETPLSHSYCQYVVGADEPLIVADARKNELLRTNPAIVDNDAIAYAGIPLHTPDGHVLGSFCVMDSEPREWTDTDVAILKDLANAAEAEIALRLAHDELLAERTRLDDERTFLQALLDSLDTGVVACDAAGRLTLFNNSMRHLHGDDADHELTAEEWADTYKLYNEDGRTQLTDKQLPLVRAFNGEWVRGEQLVICRPDGKDKRFVANARPIDTEDGRCLGAVVALHDITTAHREDILRRARHAVTQVLSETASAREAATEAVSAIARELGWLCGEYWQVEEDGLSIVRASSWTQPSSELSVFTGSETVRLQPGEGIPGLAWLKSTDIWTTDVLAQMAPFRREAAHQAGIRTGIGLPIQVEDQVIGVLAFFTDAEVSCDPDIMTMLNDVRAHVGRYIERQRLAEQRENLLVQEQEQVQRLRELDRMKDDLVAVVSHELRNPIGVIRGYAEILLDDPVLPHDLRHDVAVIDRSSKHLLHLADDLLDLARLDAGHIAIEPEPLDAAALIEDSLQTHTPSAKSKQITIVTDLAGPLPIHADPFRLRQALDNLLSNALKYTPEGGTVTVTARHSQQDVHIAIADNGIGIPREQYSQLFSRFFRASTAVDQGIKGTGLGLAVTKAIIDAHHGTITAAPAEGGGTVFAIVLPRAAG